MSYLSVNTHQQVRSVGELLENQYRVGLLKMDRAIKERLSSLEVDNIMPLLILLQNYLQLVIT